MKNNIILIGLSTCGKTTIGRALSKALNMNFIDCDEYIEEKTKLTINEIFTNYGENYFRELEKDFVEELKRYENTVISTGGGMPIYNNNIDSLKEIGLVIFLNTPLEDLIRRNEKVKNRPLLKEDIESKINKLYEERINIYNRAHYTIDAKGLNHKDLLKTVINIVKEFKF